jgi:hypothetical protein
MQQYFNVAGPCVPDEHYMLPAQERCRGVMDLIEQAQYFVIHAARQSGKTTLLLELTDHVNSQSSVVYIKKAVPPGKCKPNEGAELSTEYQHGPFQRRGGTHLFPRFLVQN